MTEKFELLACSGAISRQRTRWKAFTLAALVELAVKVACIFECGKFFAEFGEKLLLKLH